MSWVKCSIAWPPHAAWLKCKVCDDCTSESCPFVPKDKEKHEHWHAKIHAHLCEFSKICMDTSSKDTQTNM